MVTQETEPERGRTDAPEHAAETDSTPGRHAVSTPIEPDGPPRPSLPLWFERGLVIALCGVVSLGSFGLLMAFFGHFSAPLVFSVAAVMTVVLSLLAWPRRSTSPGTTRIATLPALGMIVVALGFLTWNGVYDGHYVMIDRDPGVYAAAGKWIAANGSLEVPAGAQWVSKGTEFNWASAGMYPEGNGRLEFQFNHMAPVLFAEANDVGGDRAMFAMPALLGALGLCALFAAGCRLVRRPWLVLAAVTGLAVSMPMMFVARDTYSETSAMFLLWSGLWLLLTAYERRRLGMAFVGGATIAATLLSRVDALVYLIPLPFLAAMVFVAARTSVERRFLWRMYVLVALAAAPMIALGTVDLMYRATGYYAALGSQVSMLRLGFLLSAVAGVVLVVIWPRLPALQQWAGGRRDRVAMVAGGVAAIGLLLAWAIRPAIQHTHGVVNATVSGRQQVEGLPIDATRTYNEQTMTWMSWYLGPIALALAVIGIGLLVWRFVRAPEPAVAMLLMVAGIGTALYLFTAQITPTQIWAMRRYVPAALPFLALSAAYAVDTGTTLLPRFGVKRVWTRVLPAVCAVAVIAFPLGTVAPVRDFQSQAGFITVVDKTCARVGSNAAVILVPDDILRLTMPQTIRSYCGVPATQLRVAVTAERLRAIAASWKQQGRTLWVIGSSPALIDKSAPGLTPALVAAAANNLELDETLSHAPTSYRTERLTVYAAQVSP